MLSRPANDVLSEINKLVEQGYPEIVLTGVRLGKYKGGIENLIKSILELKGEFRVRLSSLEVNEVSGKLLRLMKENPRRLCRHLHLPLQSGSDKILKQMRRPYTVEQFSAKVRSVYKILPDAGISTDIIVGFPGETDKDFNETYALAKKLKFSRLHVFRFSKISAGFKSEVSAEKIKGRSAVLRELGNELETSFWKRFVGTVRPAVIEGNKNTFLTNETYEAQF